MKVGSHNLRERVLVVAEIGNNHEGSLDVAKKLVRKAAECGVAAVKFQTFKTRWFVNDQDRARYERLSRFELSDQDFEELHRLAASLNLLFFSTPLDLKSAVFLQPLVDAFKIASGDNDFYPLLDRVSMTGKPIIMSSGVSDLLQLTASVAFIRKRWKHYGITQDLAVLQCVSSYPTPSDEVNLAAIGYLASELGCTVGYSDHTTGTEAAILSVAAGARIVEKHFTLDKEYSDFRDHGLSADPQDMTCLVREISRVSTIIGIPEKIVQPCETQALPLVRRSIVAGGSFEAGHRIRFEDLTWIRPGDGLRPGEEHRIVGRRLRAPKQFGEKILLSDVE